MAQNKTVETTNSVATFLSAIADDSKRTDSQQLVSIIEAQTGASPKMWGPAIVGFGSYHYKYESGREGDAPLVGFSPRKDALTLYLSSGFPEREPLLTQLGKHKTGKGCVYIKKLSDVNLDVLQELISHAFQYKQQTS
ncbi:DUF1801 domain-containing protein [Arsenicibacter rosenii]|uniref:YdhG-like domain-containing protein n=1 Tax=Arsenicibacter rosenii TaxID=1750698 RepID=A0A1S2VCB3_9BACT|nr:DUF1801 domain-containing protein [Arsenicibacter rosenii]OIN55955.1 hypothetical protein BLX24_27335 [Arsenicibacter rosenii]